jgi:hypothetical protein
MGRWRFWRREAPPGDRPDQQGRSGVARDGLVAGDGRAVIVHYHFFKNAGTSVDATLKENFGDGWVQRERGSDKPLLGDDLADAIRGDPNIAVISSHTALMPPPVVPGCTIVPVAFVRHPLDRLRSIYEFERRQDAETPGAVMAKQLDLAGYLEWRLERSSGRDSTARSDQTYRLAGFRAKNPERLARALARLDELAFVGLVEEFGASIEGLQSVLVRIFPHVRLRPVWENASARQTSLAERLERFREAIPEDLYQRLLAANEDDVALWHEVARRYGVAASVLASGAEMSASARAASAHSQT